MLKLLRGSPPPEGDITALLSKVILFQVLVEFLRKVLERKCPPLAGVNFELGTYSGFRGRIMYLF
jgi:hypothetical protein